MTTTRGTRVGAELSERELSILWRVAAGGTNREIGKDLYIEVNTVKSHVSRICTKLGARGRSHAVALAFRKGILK